MKDKTRRNLEAVGARVTTVQEFLGLSDADVAFIDMKLALARELRQRRESAQLTQVEAAKRLGSSQSRIAKMEAGDPTVSIDLLVGALLKLGATPRALGRTIGAVERPAPRAQRGQKDSLRPRRRA
jgi:DNA-binding XRE family transcriptional regulator